METAKLEKLKIKGFKSFARTVSIRFSPGITAIVGPNGSGKSNIIDALGFVMGSLSFSQFRAKKAVELLYMGAKKKAEEALVELEISDPDKKLSQEGVLRISRKLLKDGSSVYRVNGRRSTRLAVLDALAALNIFPDAHNVIKQGDFDRFLKMSSMDRRRMIEVIAGIELYEKKKERALRNLEEVEIKLEKVKAVHAERLKIYERVKREVEKVERFFELKKAEKRARKGILLSRKDSIGKEIKKIENEKQKCEEEIKIIKKMQEELGEKKKKLEKELEDAGMKKQVELARKSEEIKFQIKKIEEERRRKMEEIASAERRIESLKTQLSGLDKRKEEIEKEITKKGEEMKEIEEELEKLKKERDEKVAHLARVRQEYEKLKKEAEENRRKREELLERLHEAEAEIKANERVLANLQRQVEALKEEKNKLEMKKRKEIEEKKKMERELAKIAGEKSKAKKELEELKMEAKALEISKIPQISMFIASKGFNLLGSIVDSEKLKEIAPLSVWPVADEEEIKRIEKIVKEEGGWCAIIPKGNEEKLAQITRDVVVVGDVKKEDFLEEEKIKKLKKIREKIRELEKILDAISEKETQLKIKLSIKGDYSRILEIEKMLKEIKAEIKQRKEQEKNLQRKIAEIKNRIASIKVVEIKIPEPIEIEKLAQKISDLENRRMSINSEIKVAKETLSQLIIPEMKKTEKVIRELEREIEKIKGEIKSIEKERRELEKKLEMIEAERGKFEKQLNEKIAEKGKIEEKLAEISSRLIELEKKIASLNERKISVGKEMEEVDLQLKEFEDVEPIEKPAEVLRRVMEELKHLGPINFRAKEEFEEIASMVEEINEKIEKLEKEKEAILKMMDEIEEKKKEAFMKTFLGIKENFERLFSTLLHMKGYLELDSSDIFNAGVDIIVEVNGNKMPVSALSGGQKALVTLAFIVAIQKFKPSPFYIFDEVDAPLDKENTQLFVKILREMTKTSQVIIVTHNDLVVRGADQIIGVYKQRGESKIISLPKERVLKEAEKWISA